VIDRKPPCLREHVVLAPESTWTDTSSDVLSGHERVAHAIVEAWLADNPREISSELALWIAENAAADVADVKWGKRWQAELAAAPAVGEALKRGSEELFERAELTKFQRLAMRSLASGRTPKEIGLSTGCTADAARSRIDEARKKIFALSAP
jgi:hypothetical protein